MSAARIASMTTPDPKPLPRVKPRMPFAERPSIPGGGGIKRASVSIYAVLTLGLAGVAVYMAVIVGHPLMSPYVVAPGVGALWFGLRLFMHLAPRH
jgi:hypothetical protein